MATIVRQKDNFMTIKMKNLPDWGLARARKGDVYGLEVVGRSRGRVEFNFVKLNKKSI